MCWWKRGEDKKYDAADFVQEEERRIPARERRLFCDGEQRIGSADVGRAMKTKGGEKFKR